MKKLSKLKLKEFHEMSNSEMRQIVGGYELPEVTIYGCKDKWKIDLPTKCTVADCDNHRTCRTEDCAHVGTCMISLFYYQPICAY